jgi:hypothetical protein
MELTEKELISFYRYVYLKMNISAYRNYLLKKINNDFITKIFTDINFYNNPNFNGFDLLKTYNDLQFILKMYEKIKKAV